MLRMVANALLDALIGAVPIAGTVGDIFWRANTANLALVEHYAQPGRRPTRADYGFLFVVTLVFGLMVAIPVFLAIWLAIAFWRLI
jgi:predicted metal-binding membrane protein